MANPKKQWFTVPDSKTKREDGKGFYFNVEARFSDHPVINVEKSKAARHNVYDWSIVLHTRVVRAPDGSPAQKNATGHVMRFDKGEAMGGLDFERAKRDIMRCWDAWLHYQTFREAPVTVAERMALEQIDAMPLSALGTVKVDVGGKLVDARLAGADEDDFDDDEDEDEVPAPVVAQPTRKPAGGRKAKSAA